MVLLPGLTTLMITCGVRSPARHAMRARGRPTTTGHRPGFEAVLESTTQNCRGRRSKGPPMLGEDGGIGDCGRRSTSESAYSGRTLHRDCGANPASARRGTEGFRAGSHTWHPPLTYCRAYRI